MKCIKNTRANHDLTKGQTFAELQKLELVKVKKWQDEKPQPNKEGKNHAKKMMNVAADYEELSTSHAFQARAFMTTRVFFNEHEKPMYNTVSATQTVKTES